MFRTRIRVNFSGEHQSHTPTELHDLKISGSNIRTSALKELEAECTPILALNEVQISFQILIYNLQLSILNLF